MFAGGSHFNESSQSGGKKSAAKVFRSFRRVCVLRFSDGFVNRKSEAHHRGRDFVSANMQRFAELGGKLKLCKRRIL